MSMTERMPVGPLQAQPSCMQCEAAFFFVRVFQCPFGHRTDGYQIVATCLQARIFASFVTRTIPSASAVAPIKRSHGSLE